MIPPLDDEAFVAFLAEAREHLETLEQHLLVIEKQGTSIDEESINSIFRAAHTIKGTAGFFGLEAVKELAHAAEDVLGLVRSRELAPSADVTTALLTSTDLLGQMLADTTQIDRVNAKPVVAKLRAFSLPPGPASSPAADASRVAVTLRPGAQPASVPTPSLTAIAVIPPPPSPVALATSLGASPTDTGPNRAPAANGTPAIIGAPAANGAPAATANPAATMLVPEVDLGRRLEAASTIRVNLGQLDRLMMLAGELVLTRNALLKKASERDVDEMINLSQRVDAITSELQDGIMATRMQPVGLVFTKFRRIIRDLAQGLRKKLHIEITGEDVELDRTLIEALTDPLTHLVRNAADHGIEPPERRVAAGKAEAGKIELCARHEAGQVVIEVRDDGAGIDPDRLAEKAIEKRMFTREQLAAMSTDEKIRLVFAPGFSTATEVTDVSGRGVGMDVVLSSLTKVGGVVDIRSAVGRGTTVSIRLPLTLAIIPSLLVGVNDERFAIPQVNLVELVRIPPADVKRRIERIGSAAVMRLRGELLPLIRLSDVLGIPRIAIDPATGDAFPDRRDQGFDRRSADATAAEGAEVSDRRSEPERRRARFERGKRRRPRFRQPSLRADCRSPSRLRGDRRQATGSHLAGSHEYAGATILGDGAVALILDVAGICASAGLTAAKAAIEAAENRRAVRTSHDAQTYLVVENGPGEHFVIPLGLVSRIERVPSSAIVEFGGRRTINHGASILALVGLEEVAQVKPREPAAHFFAIICRIGGREVGVTASRVVDIVDGTTPIDPATHLQPGILGSTIIEGRLMLLVDIFGLIDARLPEYRRKTANNTASANPLTVLVVEDSPFFRKQLVTCLTEEGWLTLSAADGEEGLSLLNEHPDAIALVITDIEMPRIDGLEMTRRIRADGRFSHVPILACTSISGEVAERRGRDAGLTEYLIKLDREQIVERTSHYLKRARDADPDSLEGAFPEELANEPHRDRREQDPKAQGRAAHRHQRQTRHLRQRLRGEAPSGAGVCPEGLPRRGHLRHRRRQP